MIPKIIHQIHLGSKCLSELEKKWQSSWVQHHPDWKYCMWTDKCIETRLKITHPEILNTCDSFSEKSDILRFEILYQYGGLYIDTDFECLKPIDNLLKQTDFLIYKQNKNITAGYKITCGDLQLDATLENQFERLRKDILAN